jgi:putative transposase
LEQRITAWQRRRVSVSRYEQEAELKAIRAELPDYAAIHSHVLQDALARLDRRYQAVFRRVKAGEKVGFPRYNVLAVMVRRAKSISDAGWSQFLSVLSFKAVWAGRRLIAVPPAFTSQTCSGCGGMVANGLSVRWHSCPDCRTSLHRDHNAAKNIVQALRGEAALVASENRESAKL